MARKQLDPISPGEILFEEFMQPLDISIDALARDLSVPPNRISEIVNGKRAITADTALRLARCFGTSAELCSTCRPITRCGPRGASPGRISMHKFARMLRDREGALFPLYLCR